MFAFFFKQLSSEAVTRAYIDRIIEINGLLNAVVDSRYGDALQEARLVDQLVRSGTLSESQMAEDFPLLGVPFTAKEALLIKGALFSFLNPFFSPYYA